MIINLTYYHVAKDVPENSLNVAVVIDVLRATTTISWALKNGADSIQVFADLDLLKESAMDCALNYNRNSQYKIDLSRDCEYLPCNYNEIEKVAFIFKL